MPPPPSPFVAMCARYARRPPVGLTLILTLILTLTLTLTLTLIRCARRPPAGLQMERALALLRAMHSRAWGHAERLAAEAAVEEAEEAEEEAAVAVARRAMLRPRPCRHRPSVPARAATR